MSSHDISTKSPEGELLLPSSLSPAERAALEDFVNAVQSSLGSEIVDVQLFGSKARGDATPESDVDVLVVVREYEPKLIDTLYDLLLDACLDHDVYISPIHAECCQRGSDAVEVTARDLAKYRLELADQWVARAGEGETTEDPSEQ
jgi:predicted nucleotidyltransferase